jgi:hypothetical protein
MGEQKSVVQVFQGQPPRVSSSHSSWAKAFEAAENLHTGVAHTHSDDLFGPEVCAHWLPVGLYGDQVRCAGPVKRPLIEATGLCSVWIRAYELNN